MLTANDEASALELLHESGCTDGLPVIIPTAERVDRMDENEGAALGQPVGKAGFQQRDGLIGPVDPDPTAWRLTLVIQEHFHWGVYRLRTC